MKDYNIVIVGAGPAGAIFAREISRYFSEFNILLIDGQSTKKRKPCGGLLAPDAQKALAGFNLTLPKSILADPQIFAVETIDLKTGDVKYYQRHYLNMDRYRFDNWLISLIPPSVTIVSGECTSVAKRETRFAVEYIENNEKKTVTTTYLVGADGANSIVRRTFFKTRLKQYVSIQQWFQNNGQTLPYYSCIFDPETSDSCSWTIHKDQYLIFGGAFVKENCREAFEKQKLRLENFLGSNFGDPLLTEACLVSSPRKPKDFSLGNNGVFLIGEAAGFISSSSFEGISYAILSGKYLAESFCRKKDEKCILRAYKRKTLKLRTKLLFKNPKRIIICNPFLRKLVMKSGIQTIKRS